MKILLLALLFITSASYAGGFADWFGGCGDKVNNFCQAKVVRVYDGDTFYVNIEKIHSLFGDSLGIRIKGIDTPELRGGTPETKAEGIKARDFTINFLKVAKRVDLSECSRGKFFRIVCHVYADGKSLGDELIKAKLAKVYGE